MTSSTKQIVASVALLVLAPRSDAAEVATKYTCTAAMVPERVTKTFINRGVVSSAPYTMSDSISYFKAKAGFTAFGFPLVGIEAFQEGTAFFARAPGTSPGNLFALVVQAAPREVLRAMAAKGLRASNPKDWNYPVLHVEAAEEQTLPKGLDRRQPYTHVVCKPRVNMP